MADWMAEDALVVVGGWLDPCDALLLRVVSRWVGNAEMRSEYMRRAAVVRMAREERGRGVFVAGGFGPSVLGEWEDELRRLFGNPTINACRTVSRLWRAMYQTAEESFLRRTLFAVTTRYVWREVDEMFASDVDEELGLHVQLSTRGLTVLRSQRERTRRMAGRAVWRVALAVVEGPVRSSVGGRVVFYSDEENVLVVDDVM